LDYGIAAAEQHFFKKFGIAIAQVLPSRCGIAIADFKKVGSACSPLLLPQFPQYRHWVVCCAPSMQPLSGDAYSFCYEAVLWLCNKLK
jgi:hypothetical protein